MLQVKNVKPVHFQSPVKIDQLGQQDYANKGGIYIWTLHDQKNNIRYMHYIGETYGFYGRFKSHLTDLLGMQYRTYDIQDSRKGINNKIWTGMWKDKSLNSFARTLEAYKKHSKQVLEYAKEIDLHFGIVDFEGVEIETEWDISDSRKEALVRRHIEGDIAWSYREQYPELQVMYEADNMTGRQEVVLDKPIPVTSEVEIKGLISEIKN